MPDLAIHAAADAATTRYQCRHIFTDGRRCGSPCLRDGCGGHEDFCYYHHTARKPVQNLAIRRARQPFFALPDPEDRLAIQQALGAIQERIVNNEIDPRRAGLLLYGLQIASLNLARHRPSPEAAGPAEIVDQITLDPELGALAPRTELASPASEGDELQQILRDMRKAFPDRPMVP